VLKLVLVAVAALLGACSLPGDADRPASPAGAAVVLHPVDGDTVEVDIDGAVERVRLIGIDTPESVARDRPVECFGPEAKARMAELLPEGTEVRLERDVEARDRYGRLLAYVIRAADDVHINLLLVQEGFAESREFPPNTTRQAELDQAEAEARAEQRGLWPACGSTDVPVGPPPG
jgi:micrococcal nuclease